LIKSIYIAPAAPYSGKSVLTLGLVNMILGKTAKVAYFKPVILAPPAEQLDTHIQTVLSHFQLAQRYDECWVFTRNQALQYLHDNLQGLMLDAIIHRYKELENNYDFVIVEGSDFAGGGSAFEFSMNELIARNLGSPAILLVSGEGKSIEEMAQEALNFYQAYQDKDIRVLCVLVNKVSAELIPQLNEVLAKLLPDSLLKAVVPKDHALENPTVGDILRRYQRIGVQRDRQ